MAFYSKLCKISYSAIKLHISPYKYDTCINVPTRYRKVTHLQQKQGEIPISDEYIEGFGFAN